jgi:hypothetical protein
MDAVLGLDPRIAKPPALRGDGLHGLPQLKVEGSDASIPDTRAINLKSFTRPPPAHPMVRLEMGESIPLGGGRYH